MAANSLLYLILTAGLTTPPDQSATTIVPYEENTDWSIWSQTERPFEPMEDKTYRPVDWPLATEEPPYEAERHGNWPLATEEPEEETERPEVWPLKKHIYTEYTKEPSYGPTEDAAQWTGQTKWPGYGGKAQYATIPWRQDPRHSTENPNHQYTAPPVMEKENTDWSIWSQTERPFEPLEDKTYRPVDWPLATEEPPYEAERHGNWPLATEEPEEETERPEAGPQKKRSYSCPQNEHYKRCGTVCPLTCFETHPCPSNCCVEGCFCNKGFVRGPDGNCIEPEECPLDSNDEKDKRRCPSREHWTKCHKNCEKTCSDYMKPKPCPRSCKKGCVCDGGLVRNKEGKCVPRDRCPKKLMAEDGDSHGCPYEYACDVYCINHGRKSGSCEGNICKCSDR